MAVKLTSKTELTSVPANDDVLMVVDVSDTTGSTTGTSKKIDYKQLFAHTITTITSSTHTFDITNANAFIVGSPSSGSQTLTIPTNTAVSFDIGTEIRIFRNKATDLTISPDGGVNLVSQGGLTDISPRYGVATLVKLNTNLWIMYGDLA